MVLITPVVCLFWLGLITSASFLIFYDNCCICSAWFLDITLFVLIESDLCCVCFDWFWLLLCLFWLVMITVILSWLVWIHLCLFWLALFITCLVLIGYDYCCVCPDWLWLLLCFCFNLWLLLCLFWLVTITNVFRIVKVTAVQ